MVDTTQVREHMEVVGSDGQHVGTVDTVDGGAMIRLTRSLPEEGGQHHWLPLEWVQLVDGIVMLDRPAQQAMQEWSASGPREATA